MGEAKRRKMLDPNYGKVSQLESKVQEIFSPLISALVSLPGDLCWEMFEAVNSREWIGDLIEIPFERSSQTIINEFFGQEHNSIDARTINNIFRVFEFRRLNNPKIWNDLYRMILMVDNRILLKALQDKSPKETDYLLRALLFLGIHYPTFEEELYEELLQAMYNGEFLQLKQVLFNRLLDSPIGKVCNDTEKKQLSSFLLHISCFIAMQSLAQKQQQARIFTILEDMEGASEND
jgi:hypothetical protein